MTVCKQLNYRHKKNGVYGLYSEELLTDGEIDGRNWSLIERTYLRDTRWYGGKYQYILRIDISEYQAGYDKIVYKSDFSADKLYAMLTACPRGCDMLRFAIHNQSPGIWENGFNPNYWLEAKIGSYADEAEHLRKIVENGQDMRDMHDIGLVVQDVLDEIKPAMKILEAAAPCGIPYHYWWGIEEPPPPRKPVY